MKIGRIADPAALLARAVVASAVARECDAVVAAIESRTWVSATYVGARHRLTIECAAGVSRHRWLAGLVDAEMPVRGHIALPPALLTADDRGVTLEIIVLEDH